MKRIYIILIAVLSAFNLYSQDFTGIKICINPGHGGHDGDDRYIEETGFWESEGNLTKGLYLRDIMESCGATIVMTRVTNYTSDDLPLSQIGQIANENNVDFFHAIHSNGFNGTCNNPLMLFRGYDNSPIFPDAKKMGHIMWWKLWNNGNGWTRGGERNRGDWSYYPSWGTQGLGVLRHLTMPGVLSEGSFHDYPPESWRLLNPDYRKHESWVFARSYFDYFKTDTSNYGVVAGIIRDPYTTPSYYFDTKTLDKDAPIEGVTVTMNPGNYVYVSDSLHNGYYFFDSIPPGDYVLTFQAENFYADTINITVIPNNTAFTNKYLQIDTTKAPQILSYSPVSTVDDSLVINQEFQVYFDYPMDEDSVESAVSITPATNLVFDWDEDSKILTISPETIFEGATHYTLTISTKAQHKWHVPITEPYSFDFYTKKRSNLALVDMYPKDGMEEVSTLLQFRLYFDTPLDASTIKDNIIVVDSNNDTVSVHKEIIYDEDGKGFYFFEAENELALNSYYKLMILENLTDAYGTKLNDNFEISFKTMEKPYELGDVFLDFETLSGWWDPNGSGSTTGTVDELTNFSLSTQNVINGSYSGRLDYVFENDKDGLCREHNATKPSVGSDQNSKVGFWVYGDLSYNILEYWFYPPTGFSRVVVDTIDWAGWQLRYIPFSAINSSGSTRFTSVVVVQTEKGAKKGSLFFDDGQIISTVGTDDISFNVPVIEQNYPNPFDTYTTFRFYIPDDSYVRLSVYDLMGKKVASLINEKRNSGYYSYQWDGTSDKGSALSKGMYVYKFETISVSDRSDVHMQTGKCMLIR